MYYQIAFVNLVVNNVNVNIMLLNVFNTYFFMKKYSKKIELKVNPKIYLKFIKTDKIKHWTLSTNGTNRKQLLFSYLYTGMCRRK